MANKIGTAILELVTDVTKMTSGINSGVAAVKDFGSKVEGVSKQINGIGNALSAAFGVLALGTIGKQFLDFAGNVSDLSHRLSVSTDTVQEWKATFGAASVDLETVAKASEVLSERLLDGDKGAVSAIEKMGLSVDALRKMKPEDRLIAVADAVGKIADQDEKLYASKALFGKGGAEMLAALDGHLGETITRMRDLGMVIDEETINAADDFGDQLGFLGQQLLGIVGQIVGPLLPALSALGNVLSWLGRNVIGPVLNVAVKAAMTLLAGFVEVVTGVLARLADLASKIPGVGDKFAGMSAALKDASAKTGAYMADLWNKTDGAGDAADRAKPQLLGLGGATEDAGKKAKKSAEEFARLTEKINELNRANASGLVKGPEYDPAAGELPGLAGLRAYVEAIDKFKASGTGAKPLGIDPQTIERSIAGAGATGLEKLGVVLEKVVYQRGTSAFAQITAGIPSLLQQAFTGGGGLKGFGQALTSQVGAALGGKLFAAGGPMNGIGNKLAGLFGESFGLALPGIGQALGALVGPVLSKLWGVLKRAFGGPSQQELEGRDLEKRFEDSFGGFDKMMQRIGDAYAATGRTREQAQADVKALLDAEKQGPAAVQAWIDKINEVVHASDRAREGASRFGPSHDELVQTAKDQQATFEYMRDSGQYTAEQIQAAFEAAQEAAAAAGDEAAKAYVASKKASSEHMAALEKDLDGLISKRNELAAGLAKEAPEAVEGEIQRQQEAELKALDAQIQEKADQYASLAEQTGQAMKDAIVEALRNIHIEPVTVPVYPEYRGDWQPRGGSGEAPEPDPGLQMAVGGYGRVYSATRFTGGEAGAEDIVFGGAGRNLAQDVAAALLPLLAGATASSPAVIQTHVNIDGRTVAKAVHRVYDQSGGMRNEARELLGVG